MGDETDARYLALQGGDMRLRDQVALVTGASRGIGRAIALALAKEGAHVAVNYRQNAAAAADVAQTIQDTGRRATTVRADAAKRSEVRAMVNNVVQELGRIDVLSIMPES